MTNLLTNEKLLNDLQVSIDDAEILEQADEILQLVMDLDAGEFDQLHDVNDNPVVRVYRSETGFNLHSAAWDIAGNGVQSLFNLSDYEGDFDNVEGYDHEAAAERKVKRVEALADKAQTKLQRFLRIEKAYDEGMKNISHPYLTGKGLLPEDINIEYSVVNAALFQPNNLIELLIYKLNDDAYQVITPAKINDTNKFIIIREASAAKGAYAVVGEGEPEFIVEGLADAISASMALQKPVAVGINAGNIKVVAERFPELILIGDNDDAGRLSATQSGLDAIFCPDHKDVDDFRQDKGIDQVARYLRREVGRIKRDREPTLGTSGMRMTLVSAPPGSGKSYLECQRVIQRTGLTIYAVHNKAAMGQGDSRVSDIRMLCDQNADYNLPTIRTVNDAESEDTITMQFNNALAEYTTDENEDKNWVVFITHRGLSLMDFEQELPINTSLVIDEVPDAFTINNQAMNSENLNIYLAFFDVSVREFSEYYIVEFLRLNPRGHAFYRNDDNKSNMETRLYWKLIEQTRKNRNHTNFLHIARVAPTFEEQRNDTYSGDIVICKSDLEGNSGAWNLYVGSKPKINKCEIFDSSIFEGFSEVRMLSDDVENSVLALLLKNTQGVNFDIERISSRHSNGIVDRIDRVIGITDKVFSKHKLDTRPDLSNNIADALAVECDLGNSIWLLNNSSRENGDALVRLRDKGFEVTDFNPMTHGRNDLVSYDTVIMLYSLKPNPIEVALLEILGVSREEITRWREHNVHMQNAFRCFLRNPNSTTTGTLVFPDKASIEYFLGRVEAEWGLAERELVEAKVSYLMAESIVSDFESKKVGRKCAGSEPLTGAEKNKLSRWRKDYPELNSFAETLALSLKDIVKIKVGQIGKRYNEWLSSLVEDIETPDDNGGFTC